MAGLDPLPSDQAHQMATLKLTNVTPNHQIYAPASTTAVPIYNVLEPQEDGMEATARLRDSVYMSPALQNLTNTLRSKKKCQGAHLGNSCQQVNDPSMLPESEVVFRAVSPHGHVYWEIDPRARDQCSSVVTISDEDDRTGGQTSSSDMSSSRQSSSRYSDNHPLIGDSPQNVGGHVLVNPFADVQLLSSSSVSSSPINKGAFTNHRTGSTSDQRFSSLRIGGSNAGGANQIRNQLVNHFGTRSNAGSRNKHKRSKHKQQSGSDDSSQISNVPEQLQRQVQIRGLKSIPVSVKSNDYIMTKIQSHMSRGSPVELTKANNPAVERKV